jgi:hypothetical protein
MAIVEGTVICDGCIDGKINAATVLGRAQQKQLALLGKSGGDDAVGCCDDALNTTCIYVCWKIISLVMVSDLAVQKQHGETHADTLTSPNRNVIPSPNKRTHFRYAIV